MNTLVPKLSFFLLRATWLGTGGQINTVVQNYVFFSAIWFGTGGQVDTVVPKLFF